MIKYSLLVVYKLLIYIIANYILIAGYKKRWNLSYRPIFPVFFSFLKRLTDLLSIFPFQKTGSSFPPRLHFSPVFDPRCKSLSTGCCCTTRTGPYAALNLAGTAGSSGWQALAFSNLLFGELEFYCWRFFQKNEKKSRKGCGRGTYERIMASPPFGTYSSPVAPMATLNWAFFFSFFFWKKANQEKGWKKKNNRFFNF